MSPYLDCRRRVLACTCWLSDHGFFGALRGTGGNVSMRVPGQDLIAVTPTSRPYRSLTPEDICIVDFERNVIEGNHPPSMETGMHLAVYRTRADAGAVIHTHQPRASVFALLNRSIPALFDEVVLHLGHVVDVVPYALSGTPELAANVAAKVSNGCHAYILQNHGALCLGATLDDALVNVELLEKTAEAYLAALGTGGEVTRLPEEITGHMIELRREAQQKGIPVCLTPLPAAQDTDADTG